MSSITFGQTVSGHPAFASPTNTTRALANDVVYGDLVGVSEDELVTALLALLHSIRPYDPATKLLRRALSFSSTFVLSNCIGPGETTVQGTDTFSLIRHWALRGREAENPDALAIQLHRTFGFTKPDIVALAVVPQMQGWAPETLAIFPAEVKRRYRADDPPPEYETSSAASSIARNRGRLSATRADKETGRLWAQAIAQETAYIFQHLEMFGSALGKVMVGTRFSRLVAVSNAPRVLAMEVPQHRLEPAVSLDSLVRRYVDWSGFLAWDLRGSAGMDFVHATADECALSVLFRFWRSAESILASIPIQPPLSKIVRPSQADLIRSFVDGAQHLESGNLALLRTLASRRETLASFLSHISNNPRARLDARQPSRASPEPAERHTRCSRSPLPGDESASYPEHPTTEPRISRASATHYSSRRQPAPLAQIDALQRHIDADGDAETISSAELLLQSPAAVEAVARELDVTVLFVTAEHMDRLVRLHEQAAIGPLALPHSPDPTIPSLMTARTHSPHQLAT